MRSIVAFAIVCLFFTPTSTTAQTVVVQGSAGPTLLDAGVSVTGGIGFSPIPRLTLLAEVESTHIFGRSRNEGRGTSSAFRGGTVTLGSVEIRAALRPPDRVSPYGLAGVGIGISRPNVNATFPNRVTNTSRVMFFGGGVQVPLREHVQLFADARMVIGSEAGELLAFAPVRAGLAWRF